MTRSLTIDDLFNIERCAQILISHDGKDAWLISRTYDLPQNTSASHLTHFDLETRTATPCNLCSHPVSDIALSGNDQFLFFVANQQVWRANRDGSHARQITNGAGDASCPVPDYDGKRVIFTRKVYMRPDAQNQFEKNGSTPSLADIYGLSHPKAKARTTTQLLYRHWDTWTENARNHLFAADCETGQIRDLTPQDADTPPIALESARDYAISPDGTHIAFVKNTDDCVARSTNNSIYLADFSGLEISHIQRISTSDGCDVAPTFLSNSKLAYQSMLTPGYESDAVRLKCYDLVSQQTQLFLQHFERSVDAFLPLTNHRILILSQDFAHESLFILDTQNDTIQQLTCGKTYTKVAATADLSRVLCVVESLHTPAELVELTNLIPFEPRLSFDSDQTSHECLTPLTHFASVLSDVAMNPGMRTLFTYKNQTLEGYLVTPPNFDPNQRYPFILLIHGGPQGAFLDSFHYRWNVQMFAAQGAIVGFCNPHGSTGYGHDLTRAISKHWSDDCPNAIMAFVDHALSIMPQIDPNRMAAAGASFGGFMINWLMGHTDRFKAFVSHDGIFNTEMSGYITDELWFNEFEFGAKPFEPSCDALRHSPHHFVKNFKTPTLVVQGEKDFRCFVSEGVALFTALQYMGVESKFLYFDEEGHWVLQPADSAVWYDEVVGWLMSHIA